MECLQCSDAHFFSVAAMLCHVSKMKVLAIRTIQCEYIAVGSVERKVSGTRGKSREKLSV
jgi:hypothetical protein